MPVFSLVAASKQASPATCASPTIIILFLASMWQADKFAVLVLLKKFDWLQVWQNFIEEVSTSLDCQCQVATAVAIWRGIRKVAMAAGRDKLQRKEGIAVVAWKRENYKRRKFLFNCVLIETGVILYKPLTEKFEKIKSHEKSRIFIIFLSASYLLVLLGKLVNFSFLFFMKNFFIISNWL